MILLISLSGCSGESYNDNPRFENSYFIFDRSHMDSVYVFKPSENKFLYNVKGELDFDNFERMENTFVEFKGDSIFFYGQADFLYYDGELSNEQQWQQDAGVHSLKLDFPVDPDPDSEFNTLSTSIERWN